MHTPSYKTRRLSWFSMQLSNETAANYTKTRIDNCWKRANLISASFVFLQSFDKYHKSFCCLLCADENKFHRNITMNGKPPQFNSYLICILLHNNGAPFSRPSFFIQPSREIFQPSNNANSHVNYDPTSTPRCKLPWNILFKNWRNSIFLKKKPTHGSCLYLCKYLLKIEWWYDWLRFA